MPAPIEITPEMVNAIKVGRGSIPPRTWKAIADELGVSVKTPINIAIRNGFFRRTYQNGCDHILNDKNSRIVTNSQGYVYVRCLMCHSIRQKKTRDARKLAAECVTANG